MAASFPIQHPPRIVLAGTYPFRPGEQVGGWWSASQHVVVGLDGAGVVQVAGQDHLLAAGSAVVVPWGVLVSWRADRKSGLTIASLHLTALPWDAPTPGFPRHGQAKEPPPAAPRGLPVLPRTYDDLSGARLLPDLALAVVRAWDDPPSLGREMLLRGLALQLVARLLARGARLPRSPAIDPRVGDLLSWMHFNRSRVVTRAELATRTGLGQTALGRLFRQATGQSPLACFEAMRLDEARRLLDSTRLPVSEIARRSGFTDPAYFSRRFRRRFGVQPRSSRTRTLPSATG